VDEINELKRSGMSIQAISELTGYDRKTIRKYLLKPAVPGYRSRPVPSGKLEPFKPYLNERLQAGVWNAQVLLRELRKRNYTGGYTILKDWLKPQRESARVVAVRRFETPPGKQAQVDWGHLGSLAEDGNERKLWGFTITLGYSRMMMAEAATDQKLGTLLRMHETAFRQWGAVPAEILYDRMKTIWTGTDERGEIIWNAVFLDFARYRGFTDHWRSRTGQLIQDKVCMPLRLWSAVPPLSGADEREDRVRSEIRPAEFSVRTPGARTSQSRRLQCRVAQMGGGGCQSASAWHDRRRSAEAVRRGSVRHAHGERTS
jgi:transposase